MSSAPASDDATLVALAASGSEHAFRTQIGRAHV